MIAWLFMVAMFQMQAVVGMVSGSDMVTGE